MMLISQLSLGIFLFLIEPSFTQFNSSLLSSLSITIPTTSTTVLMPNVPITMTSSNCSACKYSCRCTIDPIFMSMNCSSYLLNITYDGCSTDWYEINFSSRNLEYLNHDTFKQLRTKRLLLKSNLISLIDDTTFTSMSVILEYLDLQLNQLQQLTNWIPTLKTQLKELNIASNQLETLTHLETLTKLEVLNVSRNQIHVFPKELHYLISLITLDLSYNKLSSIPRYALNGLTNLTYLSFASNRNLSCIIQDSFKYLKSLKSLDLSSTNLKDLDACSFNQLVKLQILKIELVPLNCTSCWLRIAYENNIQTLGQCIDVTQTFNLSNSLSTLSRWCQTTAVNCSTDYCEPGTYLNIDIPSSALSVQSKRSQHRNLDIILGIIFGTIGLITLLVIAFILNRLRQGKKPCFLNVKKRSTTTSTRTIVSNDPSVIESVVTHGGNGNNRDQIYANNYIDKTRSTKDSKKRLNFGYDKHNPVFSTNPSQLKNENNLIIENTYTGGNNNGSFSEDL